MRILNRKAVTPKLLTTALKSRNVKTAPYSRRKWDTPHPANVGHSNGLSRGISPREIVVKRLNFSHRSMAQPSIMTSVNQIPLQCAGANSTTKHLTFQHTYLRHQHRISNGIAFTDQPLFSQYIDVKFKGANKIIYAVWCAAATVHILYGLQHATRYVLGRTLFPLREDRARSCWSRVGRAV